MASCYTDHDDRCAECGFPTGEYGVFLADFGLFHTDCVQRCGCGFLWPASMVSSAEIVLYCPGCAVGGVGDDAA